MSNTLSFLSSPLFYLALAVLAGALVIFLMRRRGWSVSEFEWGIPPKLKIRPPTKTATPVEPPPTGDPAPLSKAQAASTRPADADIHGVVQVGNPIIRAWRGVSTRISHVLQIGGGRIEVGGDPDSPQEPHRP